MTKKLIPLFIILAILVGISVVKRAKQTKSYDITQEMGLKNLFPENLLISDIHKIELYSGTKANESVIVAKDSNIWKLASGFQALADKDVVEKFLDKFRNLKGEPRESSKETFKNFDLEDSQALHIKLHDKEKLLFHLLVGKKIKDKNEYKNYGCFVRETGSESVYVVSEDIRFEVGIFGDTSDKSPQNSHWLEKSILNLKIGRASCRERV